MIYFDNAATSMQKPECVAQAVTKALSSFGGVGRGVHPASLAAGRTVAQARESIAELLGAPSSSRVSFAANATAALNYVIADWLGAGGCAVTTAASHNSVLRPLFKARDERGCSIRVVKHTQDGTLDWDAFEDALQGADLVVMTHASNLTGDIYDVQRAAHLAHKEQARFVLDAAQTAGAYPLDFQALEVDALCFTGHKSLLGPQGTGGIIVAEGCDVAPFLEGGSGTQSFSERHPHRMPESLEAGTLNAHGIAGLAAGVDYLGSQGIEAIAEHEANLVRTFIQGLYEIPGSVVLGGGSEAGHCGIVAFNLEGHDSSEVADYLACEYGICTRAGAHCAPLMHRALGTEKQGAIRVSFGPFNTHDEVDVCLQALTHFTDQAH